MSADLNTFGTVTVDKERLNSSVNKWSTNQKRASAEVLEVCRRRSRQMAEITSSTVTLWKPVNVHDVAEKVGGELPAVEARAASTFSVKNL